MKKYIVAVVAMSLLCCGCVRRQEKSRNADKYDNWIESLNDSVTALQNEQKQVEDSLTMLYQTVDEMSKSFDYVNHQREVEGYTILRVARASYPLTRAGIVARYTNREEFELIAACTAPFTSLKVSDASGSASTGIVPRDQALNYTTGGLTTVLFSDSLAYEVGRFIAADPSRPLSVSYSGRSQRLSQADASAVAATWRLADTRRRISSMEKRLPLISRKIEACRMHLDKK